MSPQSNHKVPPSTPAVPMPAPLSNHVPSGRASLMRIEEIHRQLSAVTPTSPGRVTIRSLAKHLEVARSTVKLDLELMDIFNAPIAYDPSRRTLYYTHPYTLRPPLWLPPEQILGLLFTVRLAACSRMIPVGPDVVRALEQIAPTLAGMTSFGPAFLDAVFSTSGRPAGEAEARHVALLCEAIVHRREVRIVYRKPNSEAGPESRVLHPLHWYLRPEACLLIAHDPKAGGRRNFELARIEQVELTAQPFTPPADFDLKKYLSGAFGSFVGEPVCDVRVHIDRDYVPYVRQRPWQDGQVLIEQPDGSAEATYSVCHTAELEQYVLRAGGRVQVIGPADVRERIRAAALRLLRAHGGVSSE